MSGDVHDDAVMAAAIRLSDATRRFLARQRTQQVIEMGWLLDVDATDELLEASGQMLDARIARVRAARADRTEGGAVVNDNELPGMWETADFIGGGTDDPCERFRLDYYTDENHRHRPEHRYCVCGWTEAHHLTDRTEGDQA